MAQILNHHVKSIGFGMMGLTQAGGPSDTEAIAVIDAAFESGANYWNGGEFYGTPERNTLHLMNAYFTKYPERASKIVLCIKGARVPGQVLFDGSEKGIRRSVDECVRVLDGKKKLNIFECARVDPNTPIEDSVRVLATLIKEGKIEGIGLSEVNAETIRRAAKVHPIAQVEVELSLWSPDILHNGVAETCADLGIPIIAYAPLSRGGLTTSLPESTSDLPEHLKRFPRFQQEALRANMQLTKEVEKLAKEKGCTVPQLAINWVKAQGGRNGLGVIVPIPGAEKPEWVRENCQEVNLSEEDLTRLSEITSKIPISGKRYNEAENRFSEG